MVVEGTTSSPQNTTHYKKGGKVGTALLRGVEWVTVMDVLN